MSHSEDFSYDAYRELLEGLQDGGYAFLGFPEAEQSLVSRTPFVLMRHDIDFDLDAAVRMAEIDAAAGVRSTFFFLVRTSFYNVFSIHGTRAVRAILDLGHHIGLHFDCASWPDAGTHNELAAACSLESNMLERWFDRQIEIVSYHQPSPVALASPFKATAPRPHTYLPVFTNEITYRSDSRGSWRHGHPLESDAFQERRPMHILIHPIWWGSGAPDPHSSLSGFSNELHDRLEHEIARNCITYRVGRFADVTNEVSP